MSWLHTFTGNVAWLYHRTPSGFCEQQHDRYTPKLSDRKIIKKIRSNNN